MLNLESIKQFAQKYQTQEKNVVREYIQHLFLSYLYRQKESEALLFKGGTALRFLYRSPRFSEDLDFTGIQVIAKQVELMFEKVLLEIERYGIKTDFSEAKETSGGYLGIIEYSFLDFSEGMKFEVSLREGKEIHGELATIINDYINTYTLIHLPAPEMVRGKIEALLDREEPRDFYDLYFLLRHPELNKYVDKRLQKKVLVSLKRSNIDFKKELSVLLPVSHHAVLKDFRVVLEREIERYF